MKLMIGYDVRRMPMTLLTIWASLPHEGEVLVLWVEDLLESSSPPPFAFDLRSLASHRAEAVLSGAKDHMQQLVKETKESATQTADRLRL